MKAENSKIKKRVNEKDYHHVSSPGKVEQIREILFGSQMKDYEIKFSRLEESIMKEVSSLKEDENKRLNSLRQYIEKEIEVLGNKILAERSAREDSLKRQNLELNKCIKELVKNLNTLEQSTDLDLSNLRKSLLEQSNNLLNEITKKYQESTSLINKSQLALKNDKIDRTFLSNLLSQMAISLSDSNYFEDTGNQNLTQ